MSERAGATRSFGGRVRATLLVVELVACIGWPTWLLLRSLHHGPVLAVFLVPAVLGWAGALRCVHRDIVDGRPPADPRARTSIGLMLLAGTLPAALWVGPHGVKLVEHVLAGRTEHLAFGLRFTFMAAGLGPALYYGVRRMLWVWWPRAGSPSTV